VRVPLQTPQLPILNHMDTMRVSHIVVCSGGMPTHSPSLAVCCERPSSTTRRGVGGRETH
jgi:hypothetical protein